MEERESGRKNQDMFCLKVAVRRERFSECKEVNEESEDGIMMERMKGRGRYNEGSNGEMKKVTKERATIYRAG